MLNDLEPQGRRCECCNAVHALPNKCLALEPTIVTSLKLSSQPFYGQSQEKSLADQGKRKKKEDEDLSLHQDNIPDAQEESKGGWNL